MEQPQSILEDHEKMKKIFPNIKSIGQTVLFDEKYGKNCFFNIGNTCFMNSILQCLTKTIPLVQYVLSPQFLNNIDIDNPQMLIVLSFYKIVQNMWEANNCMIKPINLQKWMLLLSKDFRMFQQEDAHELFLLILDAFHSVLKYSEHAEGISQPEKSQMLIEMSMETDEYEHKILKTLEKSYKGKTSIIRNLFGGIYHTTLNCPTCHTTKHKFSTFFDVQLEVPIGTPTTLSQCISCHTATEQLDNENEITCTKCKTRVNMFKTEMFYKLPKILVFNLKRFNNLGRKINTPVSYPISFKIEIGQEILEYNLYAICLHSGNCSGGHYTAITKQNGKWFLFNDTHMVEIQESEIITNSAYVLFYIKTE